jgi:hypothetical protein
MMISILMFIIFYIKFNLFFITKIMNVNCDELFNILFSNKNNKNNPYKNYILNFIDIFCNKHIYKPFIDTFYFNKQFNFQIKNFFYNSNYIYIINYWNYFHSNPFTDFKTYITNKDNTVFIIDYFYKCIHYNIFTTIF